MSPRISFRSGRPLLEACLASILLTGFFTPLAGQSEGQRIFNDNRARVLIVRTQYRNQPLGSGSAFVAEFSGKKYLITNYHVISSGDFYIEADGKKYENARVLRVNVRGDIAIASFPGIDELTPVALDAYDPERGEKVYAMGFPGVPGNRDVSLTITDGLVSNNSLMLPDEGQFRRRFIQISAAVNSGNSGGPVFNGEGKLIGMATGYFQEKQAMNLAIPTADIIREVQRIETGGGDSAANERELRESAETLAESLKTGTLADFGGYFAPAYRREMYAPARQANQRVYYAYLLAASREPQNSEQFSGYIGTQLTLEEYSFYHMLALYFAQNELNDFGQMLAALNFDPGIATQLYLSGRMTAHMVRSANLNRDEQFEYAAHRIGPIRVAGDGKTAEVEITVQLRSKSFPIKLNFVNEWGAWFLGPLPDPPPTESPGAPNDNAPRAAPGGATPNRGAPK